VKEKPNGGVPAGQQVQVGVGRFPLVDPRSRGTERAVRGLLPDSVPDDLFRTEGNTLFPSPRPADWPTHSIHKCNRNNRSRKRS
jgi:hypothetical protein